MAESSFKLTNQMAIALQNVDQSEADPHSQLWFRKCARLYDDGNPPDARDPKFFKMYFVNNQLPPEAAQGLMATDAQVNSIKKEPMLLDVECGPLRIKGTYTIDGDKLNGEVGLQAAPETYLKLGDLNGNPKKGPIKVDFKKNPDFYKGDVTVRLRSDAEVAQLAEDGGVQAFGIFGGLVGSVNWKGLGQSIAKRAIEVLAGI